jgi:mRNA interferase MazF
MEQAERGEVWLVDLGFVAKIRPCVVLSHPAAMDNRALVTLVPHTTSTRNTAFEVLSHERFLKPGAFDAQSLITAPHAKLIRRLGMLPVERLDEIASAVARWLGISHTF